MRLGYKLANLTSCGGIPAAGSFMCAIGFMLTGLQACATRISERNTDLIMFDGTCEVRRVNFGDRTEAWQH
jgi:hypothetical protein